MARREIKNLPKPDKPPTALGPVGVELTEVIKVIETPESKIKPTLLDLAKENGVVQDKFESKINYVGPIGAGLGPTPPTDDDLVKCRAANWPAGDPNLEPKDPHLEKCKCPVHKARPGVHYNVPLGGRRLTETKIPSDEIVELFHAEVAEIMNTDLSFANDYMRKGQTVSLPKPGPGVPSGGRRLRRHLKD